MEHRWNARKEINSRVTVYPRHFGVINATVKNIGTNGMLLDTGRFNLQIGGMVELAHAVFRALHLTATRRCLAQPVFSARREKSSPFHLDPAGSYFHDLRFLQHNRVLGIGWKRFASASKRYIQGGVL
jgi:hypothetical protein